MLLAACLAGRTLNGLPPRHPLTGSAAFAAGMHQAAACPAAHLCQCQSGTSSRSRWAPGRLQRGPALDAKQAPAARMVMATVSAATGIMAAAAAQMCGCASAGRASCACKMCQVRPCLECQQEQLCLPVWVCACSAFATSASSPITQAASRAMVASDALETLRQCAAALPGGVFAAAPWQKSRAASALTDSCCHFLQARQGARCWSSMTHPMAQRWALYS